MACSSSCRTQDHTSLGACMRAKGVRVAAVDTTQQKRADKNLDAYEAARKAGIQPATTRPWDVDAAIRISEHTGTAYQAV